MIAVCPTLMLRVPSMLLPCVIVVAVMRGMDSRAANCILQSCFDLLLDIKNGLRFDMDAIGRLSARMLPCRRRAPQNFLIFVVALQRECNSLAVADSQIVSAAIWQTRPLV